MMCWVGRMRNANDGRKRVSTAGYGLLRDLSRGLKQQMFFWGRDVIHRRGNQLVAQGFERIASSKLQGTSCYRKPWCDGVIELHGASAGWFGASGGMIYIRPHDACYAWKSERPAIPGDWPESLLEGGGAVMRDVALGKFLEWWLQSERWIEAAHGAGYRRECFQLFKKLPKTRAWLEPGAAVAWLSGLQNSAGCPPRWKTFRAA